jgi:hypothetical protein
LLGRACERAASSLEDSALHIAPRARFEAENIDEETDMINLIQPSMALNARNSTPTKGYDVPGPTYSMWNTWQVSNDNSPSKICGWIASVAGSAPDFSGSGHGGILNHVVFNCHGHPASLNMGTRINFDDLSNFSQLAGLVSNIWLIACDVVSFTGGNDGNMFCCAMAKFAQCNVYASDHWQSTGLWPTFPYAIIDGYEGNVWKWHPDGSNEPVNPSGIL